MYGTYLGGASVIRLVCTITTPSNHKAVAAQVAPPEGHEGPPRFRFPVEMLQCERSLEQLRQAVSELPWGDVVLWWEGVRAQLRAAATRWRCDNPSSGFTELAALLRESTPVRLAPGAWEYLVDLGYQDNSVSAVYRRLVKTLNFCV